MVPEGEMGEGALGTSAATSASVSGFVTPPGATPSTPWMAVRIVSMVALLAARVCPSGTVNTMVARAAFCAGKSVCSRS